MKITVTKEHWDKGLNEAYNKDASKGDGMNNYAARCAVAQAVSAAAGSPVKHVGYSTVRFADLKVGKLPAEARNLIQLFDATERLVRLKQENKLVEPTFPIEFELAMQD